ncbi:carboxylesterase family protein [Polymorphospora rubra]|uniref:Carboxylesterase type B domain-containing protein n=1 Tax=Polymorphospora rubra TaxID=338584 RepID=A0A810N921_9ACTN|nr:carboxylesterase family protein [Polymorphospora rubra]BCJ70351.1 hypothetical protein Prubr_73720 [Polymorphospora rubra]
MLTRYPVEAYASPSAALAATQTDHFWVCPSVTAAGELAAVSPVRFYQFADPAPPQSLAIPLPPALAGPTHGAELPYLRMTDPSFGLPAAFTPQQKALSTLMVDYWTGYAQQGDPNHRGTPHWPRYDPAKANALRLAPGPRGVAPIDIRTAHQCGFWDEVAEAS